MHRKSLVILLLLLASAAAARTAGGDGPAPDTETADTVIVVDKVQVTAIKQGLVLRSQPVAASIVGGRAIERGRIGAVKNLSQTVPNFHAPDYGSRMTSSIYVRGLGARIDQPVIPGKTCRIDWSRALREDARPGNREPVRLQVHLFQQCNILCPAVVAVAGDVPCITVPCFARRMAEGIPDGQSPTILLHCALDLIGCGCRAPDEIFRK